MHGRGGWRDRPVGCRQQRGGDHQIRDRRAAPQKKDFVEMAQEYLKYHIVAVLGLYIILERV